MTKDIIETCELLTCGTEILMGQIVNTNATFLARQLTLLGINSLYQTTVGDNPIRLENAIRTALGRSDSVIITGGLGPTEDDISMAVAARVANRPLERHEPSVKAIQGYFASLNRETAEINYKQAMMPVGAHVIPNNNGTAPGAIVPVQGPHRTQYIILLPGPPLENQLMFEDEVKPFFEAHSDAKFDTTFIRMIGVGESNAATLLADLIDKQINPTIAPYSSEGEVAFRLTERLVHGEEGKGVEPLIAEIKSRLGKYIYEIGDRSLPEVLKDLLSERGLTIAFAESCTAGLVAATFGDIPGVSTVFKGGVVSYANDVKADILQVPQTILDDHGAVSEETAIAMAEGCRQVTGADLAVSITGVAGPDGGTEEKPVGLVYIGLADASGSYARKFHFLGNRNKVRKIAALNAFNMARVRLLNQ
ncbi:MAG: competence/damage-inducible protein A [Fastidiosipilaceae bacterium]|jgi:nicotinamide-nucleotide amidase|nr:competence/damage-inducible protein A [Clostridiaceae bacterium]